MNRKSQWLFEAPFVLEATYPHTYHDRQHFSNPEWETAWELPKVPHAFGEEEVVTTPKYSSRKRIIRETVSGFSRYSKTIPPQEIAKINKIAQFIVQNNISGRKPIRTIQIVGHADRDMQRGTSFEIKVSDDRALRVRGALATAIERYSKTADSKYRALPPISSRIDWQLVAAGATKLIVRNPTSELQRARNRRVEISLYPPSLYPYRLAYTKVASFSSPTPKALTAKIEKEINDFCKRIAIEKAEPISRDDCHAAVVKIIAILGKEAPKNSSCQLQYQGYQLIDSKEYRDPLSKSVVFCCQFSGPRDQSVYWGMCEKEMYKNSCGHCSRKHGLYMILKYKPLDQVIEKLKLALDGGCVVKAGVLSGICDDKPDSGCKKRIEQDPGKGGIVWRDCPEHWILIVGHDKDTFVFWDPAQSSAISMCDRKGEFGLLFYNASENRLSTAPNLAAMDVSPTGFHVKGFDEFQDIQKRYQVLALHTGGPYK